MSILSRNSQSDGSSVADWLRAKATAVKHFSRGRRLTRAKSRRLASQAKFIGVTGSSAKSTTTALLAHILAAKGTVAVHMDSNNLNGLVKLLRDKSRTHQFLLSELGVGQQGHMAPMAEALRPDVAIVTLVALEHRSAFKSIDAVTLEKGTLVEFVRPGGMAILNADDPEVMRMAARTGERVVTFGRKEASNYRAENVDAGFPRPLSLTLTWAQGSLALHSQFVAEHFWLSVAAASAAAIELGVPPDQVAERVASFVPIRHRCGTIDVPNGPHFVVDTVKAPWHSLPLAFDIVARARAPRKRIVLGHMSDFAGSDAKYRDAYRAARPIADQTLFVGEHSHRSKASTEDIENGRFMELGSPLAVAEHLKATAMPGELILLKGSSNLHLERIAMSFIDDVQCWVPDCGKAQGCDVCGLYSLSYDIHKGRKNWRRHALKKRVFRPLKSMLAMFRLG